jgi:hypothetical protein
MNLQPSNAAAARPDLQPSAAAAPLPQLEAQADVPSLARVQEEIERVIEAVPRALQRLRRGGALQAPMSRRWIPKPPP